MPSLWCKAACHADLMDPDPTDLALRVVRDCFPDALAAVLGGSAAAGRATASSDLDDLADASDRIESLAVGGQVLFAAAELLMDHHRAWTGGGKWLPRRLLAADPDRGAALLRGHVRLCESGDATQLIDAASRVMELVGGPLREGYRRTWEGVIESLA
jgi:hypothetical protein